MRATVEAVGILRRLLDRVAIPDARVPGGPSDPIWRLLSIEEHVEEAELEAAGFARVEIGTLERDGFVARADGRARSLVRWSRFSGKWFASDTLWSIDAGAIEEPVPPPGEDPQTLLSRVPSGNLGRVLELCAGAGALGIALADRAQETILSDASERSGTYGRLNIRFHGVGRCRVVRGDRLSGLAGERFDLILASPPYVPVPPSLEPFPLFAGGGPTGRALVDPLVRELPEGLSDRGEAWMVFDLAVGDPEAWLAASVPRGGVRADLEILGESEPARYARHQSLRTLRRLGAQAAAREAEIWARHFGSLGVDRIFVCRLGLRRGKGTGRVRVLRQGRLRRALRRVF